MFSASKSTSNERYASSSVPSSRPRRRHLFRSFDAVSRCHPVPTRARCRTATTPRARHRTMTTPRPHTHRLTLTRVAKWRRGAIATSFYLRRPFGPFQVSFRMNDALSGCETSRRRSVALALGCLSWWCIVRGCFCVYSTTIFTYGYELNRRARARSCAPCTTS